MAKAVAWSVTDTEARKRGEQIGLDTLVVHAVNDETIDWPVLQRITDRIVKEVKGINRVLYDLTPKPTGTIEWE